MEPIKSLQDLFDKYMTALEDTIHVVVESQGPRSLRQAFNDTAVIFADNHKVPGLVPALKFEGERVLKELVKMGAGE